MALRRSWIEIPQGSHFSLRNIPFGIISSVNDSTRRPAIAIGSSVLDLKAFSQAGGFSPVPEVHSQRDVFTHDTLNPFAALGQPVHRAVRHHLQHVLAADTPFPALLRDNPALRATALLPLASVTTHLPMRIGDYTDFYAGLRHAFTVGAILRGPQNALQPNYTHLPVAYHGRASSVVVSGTPIRRPCGQVLSATAAAGGGPPAPVYKPCGRLDIELEMGAFLCKESEMGKPVPVREAPAYVFGYVLLNDWSARDIQAWEYVPLGPFTAKNFGSTISPWVVLADALEDFRTSGIPNETPLQDYLKEETAESVFDIKLEVELKTKTGGSKLLAQTNASNLLWSYPQMIAHHTITGCNLNVGDLLGSGTISGTEKGQQGSLIEATDGGKNPVQLSNGESRIFLQDGDTVTLTAYSGNEEEGLVGFGECIGQILPALESY